MTSITEFYGWTIRPTIMSGKHLTIKKKGKSVCVTCGKEMNQQRDSAMYECEHCMNSHMD